MRHTHSAEGSCSGDSPPGLRTLSSVQENATVGLPAAGVQVFWTLYCPRTMLKTSSREPSPFFGTMYVPGVSQMRSCVASNSSRYGTSSARAAFMTRMYGAFEAPSPDSRISETACVETSSGRGHACARARAHSPPRQSLLHAIGQSNNQVHTRVGSSLYDGKVYPAATCLYVVCSHQLLTVCRRAAQEAYMTHRAGSPLGTAQAVREP